MNDTCYNIGKPWKHCVKWKKPNVKEQILYDSVSYKMSKTDKSIEAKSYITDCLQRGEKED